MHAYLSNRKPNLIRPISSCIAVAVALLLIPTIIRGTIAQSASSSTRHLLLAAQTPGEKSGVQIQTPAQDELPLDVQDAINLTIITIISQAAAMGGSPPSSISERVRQLLAKYDGKVKYKFTIRHTINRYTINGLDGRTTIMSGGEAGCSLEGELNHSVRFTDGKFGLDKGNIVVEGGTRVEVDGDPYVFESSRWKKSR